MASVSESFKDLTGLSGNKGHRKYKDLWGEEIGKRIEEQSERIEGLEATVKTMNGMTQLAVHQISTLSKENTSLRQEMTKLSAKLQEMQALPAPRTSDETEVQGE